MKKRVIKSIVLTVVFFLAMYGFSVYTNQGDTDMTADMDAATFPTISFDHAGFEVNTVVGHKNEMNMASMRDSVLPYEMGSISGNLNTYDAVVESMKYEIYTLDGETLLMEDSLDVEAEGFIIPIGDLLEEGTEAILKLVLELEEGNPIYYYTRIVRDAEFFADENVDYIMDLHDAIVTKTETVALKKGLESNSEGDNTTLQHVTIHSDMQHVLWGGLVPEIVSEVGLEIKEVNDAYLSAQLNYRVACEGDNNVNELYNVKEFFKVSYKDGNNYLLAYDRTATEVFDATNVVLSSKGVILGMTSEDIPYKVNNDGTVVAFVVERELWAYNATEEEFSFVFSFASSENNDERNHHDQHGVRILSMDDNGNMTFSVYGYMNRGTHEGESGLAIYYFNMGTNSIEEKAFIRSTESCLVIEEELNRLAYYNAEQDILYLLVEEDLYKVNLTENTTEILAENLQKDQYVTSEEGHMIAYQDAEKTNSIDVWNFAKDKQMQVEAAEGEIVTPLGFVGEDFVYGISLPENVGFDASGEAVTAMHQLEIRDAKNEVVKTYAVDGVYILSATVKGNMITLTRAKNAGSTYVEIAEDYITNNEESSGLVELKSYWTDLKETQYRLLFEDGIEDTKSRMLEPKFTLYENLLTFDSAASEEEYFFVYGYGEQVGRFTSAAEAIELADDLSGVVISPGQHYAWEEGNRVAWYRNFNIGRFVAQSGETTLDACVRKVLEYEKVDGVDVAAELESKSAEAIISEYTSGEGIRFRGSSCKEMFYLIDKGTPVIALTDSSSAVLLIGYDAVAVTYVDVASGSIRSCSIEKMNEMTAGSGRTYIGYVK